MNLLSSVLIFFSLLPLSLCGSKSKIKAHDCSGHDKSYVSFRLVNEKAMSKLPKTQLSITRSCHYCLKPSLTDSDLHGIKKILVKDNIYLSTKPAHSNLYPVIAYNQFGKKETVAQIILKNHIHLTTADIIRVGVEFQDGGIGTSININLNPQGAVKMKTLTQSNIASRLAILLNDKVVMVAVIQTVIKAEIMIFLGDYATKEEIQKVYCGIRNGLKK